MMLIIMSSAHVLAQTTEEEQKCDQPSVADAKPSYYIGLGDSRFSRKDYANAVKAYTCAADLQPNYAPIYVKRGFAYAGIQDSVAALADYS